MPNQRLANKHADYFEAIIQLRPYKQIIKDYIISQVSKRPDVRISKIVPLKSGGIDIYLTDQRFARALGQKLKRSFKGALKMSRSIYTRNRATSKDVYRVTVLFRAE